MPPMHAVEIANRQSTGGRDAGVLEATKHLHGGIIAGGAGGEGRDWLKNRATRRYGVPRLAPLGRKRGSQTPQVAAVGAASHAKPTSTGRARLLNYPRTHCDSDEAVSAQT